MSTSRPFGSSRPIAIDANADLDLLVWAENVDGGANSITTKSTHEAFGIPTPKANAEGLRVTRRAIYLARTLRVDSMPEFQTECDLIRREVVPVMDKILEMGDGDVALGTIRSAAAGVLDIPWSPNKHVKSRIMPARDVDGYLRILDPGEMPIPRDAMEIHADGLRRRAERDGVAFGPDLAVTSVYEISETLDRLVS